MMVPPPVVPEHDELNDQLNAYLDGELDAHARAAVEAHLQACPVCQLELEQLRATRAALHALSVMRAPRPFTVTAPAPAPAAGGWLERLLPWTWRFSGVAAAACLMVAALTFYFNPSAGNYGPGQMSGSLSSAEVGQARTDSAADKVANGAVPQDSANVAQGAQSAQRAAAPSAPAASGGAPGVQAAATPPGAPPGAPAPLAAQQASREAFSGTDSAGAVPAGAASTSVGGAPAPSTANTTSRQPIRGPTAARPVAPIWFGAAALLGLISAAGFILDRRGR